MQIGEIKMRNRVIWFVVGAVLVSIVVLVGTVGVIAARAGAFGARGSPQSSVSQEKAIFGVTHVFIGDGVFTPSHIEVVLGTAVTWTNKDDIPHGVIIAPGVIATQDTWQSGPLYPGASFTYTFMARGTFVYRCSEHPGMTGTVTVI
jgi:plastocyanin